jgi:hypothetical protein
MTKLTDLDARLFRAVPKEHKHMTVYGTMEMTKFICVVCKEPGYLSEAYLESKTKRKHDSDVRPYHASCYSETNGRVRKKSESDPAMSLTEFFIMEKL